MTWQIFSAHSRWKKTRKCLLPIHDGEGKYNSAFRNMSFHPNNLKTTKYKKASHWPHPSVPLADIMLQGRRSNMDHCMVHFKVGP